MILYGASSEALPAIRYLQLTTYKSIIYEILKSLVTDVEALLRAVSVSKPSSTHIRLKINSLTDMLNSTSSCGLESSPKSGDRRARRAAHRLRRAR